jgi:hypothetical protein
LSGQGEVLSKVGCNHPLQDGISSPKKMIALLNKDSIVQNVKVSVVESNDTTYIESGIFSFNLSEFLRVSVKFYKENIVEVSYIYELPSITDRDSLCENFKELFRSQKSNFTEVMNEKPIHTNASSFWNFLSYCKSKTGLLAVVVEMLNTEKPSVCVTYLY